MSKSIVHIAHDANNKRLLIVDKRDAEKDSVVCWVSKHGQVLKKGEQPKDQHKYLVKTIGGDNKKTYAMIRTEKGTFKMFGTPKRKAPSKKKNNEPKKAKKEKSGLSLADIKAIAAELKK